MGFVSAAGTAMLKKRRTGGVTASRCVLVTRGTGPRVFGGALAWCGVGPVPRDGASVGGASVGVRRVATLRFLPHGGHHSLARGWVQPLSCTVRHVPLRLRLSAPSLHNQF